MANPGRIVRCDPSGGCDGRSCLPAAHLKEAREVLWSGGLVVYATDTVYGIGADARYLESVARVSKVKMRDASEPISVMLESALVPGIAEVGVMAAEVMDLLKGDPVTFILKAKAPLPVMATDGTIAIRLPVHPVCLRLTEDLILTATSANRHGEAPALSVEEARRALGEDIDLYLDCGPVRRSLPSTIIELTGKHPVLRREGAMATDKLLMRLGRQDLRLSSGSPAALGLAHAGKRI